MGDQALMNIVCIEEMLVAAVITIKAPATIVAVVTTNVVVYL